MKNASLFIAKNVALLHHPLCNLIVKSHIFYGLQFGADFEKPKAMHVVHFSFSTNLKKLTKKLSLFNKALPGDCSFIGKIPSSLFNLTKLEYLYLSGNRFLDELPTSIGNFASLKTLEIYSINSSGTIAAFGNLTQLSSLTISGSNLVGEIPSVFMNLTQLTNLDLSQNQLTGHIPVEINNLTQLQYLQFSSNQLEGSVPSSIFELRNLETLDLSFNNLSGTVDLNMFLLSLKRLNTLVLSSNKMSLLTEATVNTYSKNINVIGLRSCNLTEFPHFLYNQKFLDSVDLSSNRIAGQVPGWFLNNVLVHAFSFSKPERI
ncbi:hypothetical protein CUMW_233910 [Citrus unshiu]|uniref:Leucine-rich repeat-containing N-terminal plant-type domain-containing protein n=1 Tax=Citrus unshiu TaxID=55188 RepID=A0A2H5QIM8_CITUN|nr:hypothetical protein CUMW_233910 [Citrus unshiu]